MIDDIRQTHDRMEHRRDVAQESGFTLSRWLRSPRGLVLLGFLASGAFYLITEHTAHLLGALPFAIFLLCPLMMLFMHGGHGGHAGHGDHGAQGGQQ